MKIYPVIDTEECTRCGLCRKDCVANAIEEATMTVNNDLCIRCSHCSAICPVGAVAFNGETGTLLNKLPENMDLYFETLIKRRRSIRHYKNKILDDSTIKRILEIVNHAPTGTNSQKVSVTVVNSFEKMHELSDIAMRFFRFLMSVLINPFTYPIIVLLSGFKGLKRLVYYKKNINRYFEGENILTPDAPALFVFHVSKRSSCPSEDGVIWATTAALYAESLGLGTCYNGFLVRGINSSDRLRRFLNIPKTNKVYEVFTAGYPDVKYVRSAYKSELKSTVII